MAGAEWQPFLYWIDGHWSCSSGPPVPVFSFRTSHWGISYAAEGSSDMRILNYHLRTYYAYLKDRKRLNSWFWRKWETSFLCQGLSCSGIYNTGWDTSQINYKRERSWLRGEKAKKTIPLFYVRWQIAFSIAVMKQLIICWPTIPPLVHRSWLNSLNLAQHIRISLQRQISVFYWFLV